MKGSVKKAIIIIGVLIVLVICVLLNLRPVENFQQKYEGVDLSADVEGAVREGTYTKYLNAHEDAACPAEDIEVDLFAYMEGEGVEVYENYEGEEKALYTDTESTVTWKVNVPEAGFYNLYLEYITVESRGLRSNVLYTSMENFRLMMRETLFLQEPGQTPQNLR